MATKDHIKEKLWIQAALKGETRFYLPQGCVNGHNVHFYVSNGHCSSCQKQHMKTKRQKWYSQGLNNAGKPRVRA
jgi:hypothetical protein